LRTPSRLTDRAGPNLGDGGPGRGPMVGRGFLALLRLSLRRPPLPRSSRLAFDLALSLGAGLVAASAGMHFYLWDDQGYSNVPTIGPLFLMQSVVGIALALATVACRRPLCAFLAGAFGFATAVGFLLTVAFRLFGWPASMSEPLAPEALAVELAAGAVLVSASLLGFWQLRDPDRPSPRGHG
jgi:hypothetical protein